MAELFQVTIPTINEHVKNICNEAELVPEATIRKFRIVQEKGKKKVSRAVDFGWHKGKPFEHNWQDFRTHKVDEACEHFQQKQKKVKKCRM